MIEWIAKLFSSRRRFEASMDEELQFHIDRQTAENIASGYAAR